MFKLHCANKKEINTKPEELTWSIIYFSIYPSGSRRNYFLQGEKVDLNLMLIVIKHQMK